MCVGVCVSQVLFVCRSGVVWSGVVNMFAGLFCSVWSCVSCALQFVLQLAPGRKDRIDPQDSALCSSDWGGERPGRVTREPHGMRHPAFGTCLRGRFRCCVFSPKMHRFAGGWDYICPVASTRSMYFKLELVLSVSVVVAQLQQPEACLKTFFRPRSTSIPTERPPQGKERIPCTPHGRPPAQPSGWPRVPWLFKHCLDVQANYLAKLYVTMTQVVNLGLGDLH